MTDALETLREDVREAVDVLAQDYAVRADAQPDFDADGYFFDLRRRIRPRLALRRREPYFDSSA